MLYLYLGDIYASAISFALCTLAIIFFLHELICRRVFVMFAALIAVDFLLAKALQLKLYLSIHISLFIICWVLQFLGT